MRPAAGQGMGSDLLQTRGGLCFEQWCGGPDRARKLGSKSWLRDVDAVAVEYITATVFVRVVAVQFDQKLWCEWQWMTARVTASERTKFAPMGRRVQQQSRSTCHLPLLQLPHTTPGRGFRGAPHPSPLPHPFPEFKARIFPSTIGATTTAGGTSHARSVTNPTPPFERRPRGGRRLR